MTHTRAVCLMVLVTLLWSIAGVVTRHLDAAQAFEVTFWRSFFNAITLAVVLTMIRGSAMWRGLLDSSRLVWLSGACWAVMFTAFMVALTLTTVANVLVVMAIGPLLTAVATRVVLHHRLPTRTWLAIAVAGIGIAGMFGIEAASGASLAGTLVALFVPLAAATNFTLLQHIGHGDKAEAQTDGQPDMLLAVFIGASLSALVSLPLAWPLAASTHDLGLLAVLGAAQLAIPCLLMVRLSSQLTAPEISLLGLLEVIFGVTWAWLGANETPANHTLIGGGLVIGALVVNEWLALRERNARTALGGV
jgi:drug/metabolite transporter (DMT)-like permease